MSVAQNHVRALKALKAKRVWSARPIPRQAQCELASGAASVSMETIPLSAFGGADLRPYMKRTSFPES